MGLFPCTNGSDVSTMASLLEIDTVYVLLPNYQLQDLKVELNSLKNLDFGLSFELL